MNQTGIPILDVIKKVQDQQSNTKSLTENPQNNFPAKSTPVANPPAGNKTDPTPSPVPQPTKETLDDLFISGVD